MRSFAICFSLCLVLPGCPQALADLEVFACEPEWAALAVELGGDRVEAESATQAQQDPHYIQARPSLIARVRNAELLVCTGAQLEVGWLPMLLSKANNPAVLPGKDGFFEASSFVTRLDVPASLDRAQGDIHPQGNPHVQTGPRNIALIAAALAERMALLDPEGAGEYRQRSREFLDRWDAAMARWEERARPLRGKRLIAHHRSWVYLEEWLGLQELGTLEPVPGIPPTTAHLSSLLDRLQQQGGVDFIVHSAYQNPKAAGWLSERTGSPVLLLPHTVGATEGATDLFALFDDLLDRLLGAQP